MTYLGSLGAEEGGAGRWGKFGSRRQRFYFVTYWPFYFKETDTPSAAEGERHREFYLLNYQLMNPTISYRRDRRTKCLSCRHRCVTRREGGGWERNRFKFALENVSFGIPGHFISSTSSRAMILNYQCVSGNISSSKVGGGGTVLVFIYFQVKIDPL